MFCSECGKEIDEGAMFCSGCGNPVHNDNSNGKGKNTASLVLGIIGVVAWIIPIIGLPIGVTSLILGLTGLKANDNKKAIAGVVLSSICLVLTIINGAIGAYQGATGTAWFQNSTANITEDSSPVEKKNKFMLKDEDGNILMSGGIKSASVAAVEEDYGSTSYAIEIQFTDSASVEFEKITEEHIGERIGIFLNEKMISNPMVQTTISGGSCHITGSFSYEEAMELAKMLSETE